MEDTFDIRRLIAILRRRWLLILGPAALIAVVGAAVALALPPTYSSTARILVESQQIPSDLARSTVTVDATERIRSIEQRLTTRQNLLELANRHGVFRSERDLSPTEIVSRMRLATRIQSVDVVNRRGTRNTTTVTTFEISFRARDAAVAARVANDFLTQVLEQNVRQRSERASETVDFFNREVERLTTALRDVEARVTAFKQEHELSLPDSIDFRRSEFNALQQAAAARDSRRIMLAQTRRTLQEAITRNDGASVTGLARSPQELELDRLRATLAQQRAVFTETHPTIRSLKAQIAGLEATVGGVAGDVSSTGQDGVTQAAPATEAQLEIERIDAELAFLDEQALQDGRRMEKLEAAISLAPEVEIALGSLMRERVTLETQYAEAVRKQADAATGERLEVNQQAERFEVIEQPQVPDQPVAPNRVMIAGASGVLGLGFGGALALLAELLNRSIRSARDMERRLELRPIVTVPYIRTAREVAGRRRTIRATLVVALLMIPIGLLLIDRLVAPLPTLTAEIVTRAGLNEWIGLVRSRLGG